MSRTRSRIAPAHASLLKDLKKRLPEAQYRALSARFEDLAVEAARLDQDVANARDRVAHVRATCTSEEETRVTLAQRQALLEVAKSRALRRCATARGLVDASKAEKANMMNEIERLNADLYAEAGKLVAEELREKQTLQADHRDVLDAYARLRSQLTLEKDRCQLAAEQIREARQFPIVSVDLEELGDDDPEPETPTALRQQFSDEHSPRTSRTFVSPRRALGHDDGRGSDDELRRDADSVVHVLDLASTRSLELPTKKFSI